MMLYKKRKLLTFYIACLILVLLRTELMKDATVTAELMKDAMGTA